MSGVLRCRNKSFIYIFIICLTTLFIFSCTHPKGDSSSSPTVVSDSSYYTALKQVTRQASVSHEFDSKFKIYATYISPEFRQALSDRYKRLYDKEVPMFPEEGVSFLVSVYTNDTSKTSLDDKKIWSLFLEQNSNRIDEYTISTISDKNRVYPFFDYVNKWSKEYVLNFHAEPGTGMNLLIANSDGKVKFSW